MADSLDGNGLNLPFVHDTSFIQTPEIVAITTKNPTDSIINSIKFQGVGVGVGVVQPPSLEPQPDFDEVLEEPLGTMSVLHEVDETLDD